MCDAYVVIGRVGKMMYQVSTETDRKAAFESALDELDNHPADGLATIEVLHLDEVVFVFHRVGNLTSIEHSQAIHVFAGVTS